MEQDDRTLLSPLLSTGDKRPIMNDKHGFHRESKRHCTQYLGYDYDHGSATISGYIPSSRGAQNSNFSGSANTLHQPNLDTDLPGYFEPESSAGLSFLSGKPDFSPWYPTYETLSGVIPIQSSEVETYAPEFGNSIESFTDGSPFNFATQTASEPNFELLLDGISPDEVAVIDEPIATMIKKEHVHEASKSPSLWDDYASIPLKFAGDSPLNLDKGDKMFQERQESINQSSGIVTSEPIEKVVLNEKTYLGQPIHVHLLRSLIGYRM